MIYLTFAGGSLLRQHCEKPVLWFAFPSAKTLNLVDPQLSIPHELNLPENPRSAHPTWQEPCWPIYGDNTVI